MLHQQDQQIHRPTLQANRLAEPTQFTGSKVELELAEAEDIAGSNRLQKNFSKGSAPLHGQVSHQRSL